MVFAIKWVIINLITVFRNLILKNLEGGGTEQKLMDVTAGPQQTASFLF